MEGKLKDMVMEERRLREMVTSSVTERKSTRQFLFGIDISFGLNFPKPWKIRTETDKEEIRESKELS